MGAATCVALPEFIYQSVEVMGYKECVCSKHTRGKK